MTGKTIREKFLAGEPAPLDREGQQKYAEYAIRPVSDADLAYARQQLILGGKHADAEDFDEALYAEFAASRVAA